MSIAFKCVLYFLSGFGECGIKWQFVMNDAQVSKSAVLFCCVSSARDTHFECIHV